MRSAPTASITSKPSWPGICTSRNTRSGAWLLDRGHRLRAVAALAHHLDVLFVLEQRQHALARHRLVVHDQGSDLVHATLRDSSTSSASAANGMTIVTASPPPGGVWNSKRVVAWIQVLETRARVAEPDAGVERVELVLRHAAAVVVHDQLQPLAVWCARTSTRPPPIFGADAVPQGVLDQRLQQQIRHRGARGCRARRRTTPAGGRRTGCARCRDTCR